MNTMRQCAFLLVLGLFPLAAEAHPGHGVFAFADGWMHPLSGWDHTIAMLAVGLWASFNRGYRAAGVVIGFLAGMLLGGVLGLGGASPGWLESALAATALVASLLVALALKPPFALQCGIAALFALLHGLAHGIELPSAVGAVGYATGFMLASLCLLLAGWAAGQIFKRSSQRRGLGWLLAAAAAGLAAG